MEALLAFIIEEASVWVRAERERWRPNAAPLDPVTVERLKPYFGAITLNRARVVDVESIENPPFYRELKARGFVNVIEFADMVGVTFDDTIALSGPVRQRLDQQHYFSLVFHELVHVAQYERLGVDRFVHHYVTSWAQSGFRYERIILEIQAYALDREFTAGSAPFSVEQRLDLLMHGMG